MYTSTNTGSEVATYGKYIATLAIPFGTRRPGPSLGCYGPLGFGPPLRVLRVLRIKGVMPNDPNPASTWFDDLVKEARVSQTLKVP